MRHLTILFTCLLLNSLTAQNPRTYAGTQLEGVASDKIAPSVQSPEATQIKSQVLYPEVNNTGQYLIELPIYTLKEKEIELPIALTYNTKSLKVNSKASWVGTGWSLSAGGMITRTVRDLPDDAEYSQVAANALGSISPIQTTRFYGWLFHRESLSNYLEDSCFEDLANCTVEGSPLSDSKERNAGKALELLKGQSFGVHDTEPDIYHFNVNGESFDFVFDRDLKPKILGLKDYIIEYEISDLGSERFNSIHDSNFYTTDSAKEEIERTHYLLKYNVDIKQFKVTSPSGFQYIFNLENAEKTKAYNKKYLMIIDLNFDSKIYEMTENSPEHITAWKISKIISPLGREVNFTYQDETIYEQPDIPIFKGHCQTETCSDAERSRYQILDDLPEYDRRSRYKTIAKQLTAIETQSTKIIFGLGNEREDSEGGRPLTSVSVYSKYNNQPTHAFKFEYDYQEADDVSNLKEVHWGKRLFLNRVLQYVGSNYEKNIALYNFNYNELKLPSRYSYEQDFWGYYNNNNAASLIPTIYVSPDKEGNPYHIFKQTANREFILPGVDRNTNKESILAGTLEKIEFSTGGYRSYLFEPNEFYDASTNQNISGGGLRVKEVQHHKADEKIVKKYSYQDSENKDRSSGQLYNMPIFSSEVNYYRKPESTYLSVRGFSPVVLWQDSTPTDYDIVDKYYLRENNLPYPQTEYDFWNYFTKRSSHPFNPINDDKNNHVLYTNIEETVEGTGKTTHQFYPPELYQDELTEVKFAEFRLTGYSNIFTVPPIRNGGGCYLGGDLKANLSGVIRSVGYNVQPYPPISRKIEDLDFSKGMKKKTIYYNSTGSKIHQLDFEYTTFRDEEELVYGVIYKPIDALCPSYSFHLGQHWTGYANYYHTVNAGAQLTQVIRKDFDHIDESKFITSIENNHYEAHPEYSVLTQVDQVNSKKETLKTKYYYAFNDEVATIEGIGVLKDHNRIDEVVQTEINLDDRTIKKDRRSYENFNDWMYEFKKEEAKGNNELEIISEITQRDYYGNVVEYYTKTEDNTTVLLWGYNYQYPIANIHNATNGEVLIALRNLSEDNIIEGKINEQHLDLINTLRNTHPHWQITTYEHKPLVGVTKITQPNGVSTHYEYDDFNRLEAIKDQDGNLIESFEYNYVNQDVSLQIEQEEEEEVTQDIVEYYKIRRCGVASGIEDVWTQAFTPGSFNSGDGVEGGSGVYYVVVSSQTTLPEGYLYRVTPTRTIGCPEDGIEQ